MNARPLIRCPHCQGTTRVRYSRQVIATARQLQLQCMEPGCGATYGAQLEITHGISPSAKPNPDVSLRMAPPRRRADNDNPGIRSPGGPEVPRRPGNDNDSLSEATG